MIWILMIKACSVRSINHFLKLYPEGAQYFVPFLFIPNSVMLTPASTRSLKLGPHGWSPLYYPAPKYLACRMMGQGG